MPNDMTREEWLTAAIIELQDWFTAKANVTIPKVRVSVGFPAGARGSSNQHVIGECWATSQTADNISAVFVSPVIDDTVRVLDVLTHELVHATAGTACGHKGEFARIARAVGLEGKLTSTKAGPELEAELARIGKYLGDYREIHGKIDPNMRKKQGTRMLKAWCPDCEFVARVTAKHADCVAHYCVNTGEYRPCTVDTATSENE